MKYLEMSRKFICSVAMPLALMFAACSDDKSVAGGSAEETGVYADLENITVAGRALNLYVTAREVGSGDEKTVAVVSGSAYADGAQVKIFGVDTATFEISEEPFIQAISDRDGNFEVKDVSPNSPYAVVEVSGKIAFAAKNPYARRDGSDIPADSMATYRAAVDLRETKDVKVNILTTLASARTLALAKSGLPFAEAKAMAEKDVLLALGIRDSLDAFDKVSYSQKTSSIFPVFIMASYLFKGVPDAVDRAAADIGENGGWRSIVYDRYLDSKGVEYRYHLLREPEFLVLLGLDSGDARIAELAEMYLFNVVEVLAERKGLCTDDRESEKNEFGLYSDFVCESGYWVLHDKELAYQKKFGTMTDERDGKKYKTFTVEYKGESRTWLAENLNYVVDNSWCYKDDSANCEKYGRLYSMWSTFDIPRDTQYIAAMWARDSIWKYQEENDVEEYEGYEQVYQEARERLLGVLDSIDGRGVCPEGWRIPTPDDWGHLFSAIYEVDENADIVAALKSKTWTKGIDGRDIIGFNMLPAGVADRRTYPSWIDNEYFLEEGVTADDFLFVNGFMDYDMGNAASYIFLGEHGEAEIVTSRSIYSVGGEAAFFRVRSDRQTVGPSDPEEGNPVRCVKN
ncbi:major paralogous domain-containing protein [Fibrobacter sp. UWCM]|uniref:FISUMP domain-containing protein n=1 Tax=Fibrobacter sp. UWCM TaxID=1896208 RepID=UPI00092086A5|nr:FISUMP domain-containing protein [Fibrobacter sp. UWCM]SHG84201.1 major paralogous domain-containing protein [Fibrobacter sp. UWCM]